MSHEPLPHDLVFSATMPSEDVTQSHNPMYKVLMWVLGAISGPLFSRALCKFSLIINYNVLIHS